MDINEAANRVHQEFGSVLPEHILSFEDAKREFLNVFSLERQKLGISDTDRTVVRSVWTVTEREGAMPAALRNILPAFVEYKPHADQDFTQKVAIVPVEEIPTYEGGKAVAFYGSPLRFRLSWNAWESGQMTLAYDPIPNAETEALTRDIDFPAPFLGLLIKKTAFNLVNIAELKLATLLPVEQEEQMRPMMVALGNMQRKLGIEVADWDRQFRTYIRSDISQQPHMRRTFDEIQARSYHNATGNNPMDYIG